MISDVSKKPFYPTHKSCREWSSFLNRLLFDGKLPRWRDVKITNLHKAYAWCCADDTKTGDRRCRILVHRRFPTFRVFYEVLVHEMIHHATYVETGQMDAEHGRFFQERADTFAKYGIRVSNIQCE